MAPIIEQPRPESAGIFEPIATTRITTDVPGMMADRVGQLYADEERTQRLARTERLIRQAEALH
jgi:hypothetical protein